MPRFPKAESEPVRVVMAAGGTAGHLVPALAVADALRVRGARVSFIGTGRGLETELVPAAGYPLDLADLRGFTRRPSPGTFLFFWSLIKGAWDCARILRRRRPQVVVGGGGYVSWAPVFLAALARRPSLIIELDSHMGLANRALAPLVTRVVLCFDIPGRGGGKYLRAGRPFGRSLLEATAAEGRRRFGLEEGKPVVLVTGGSLGARSINNACMEAFGHGGPLFQVVHVSGRRDYGEMRELLRQGGDPVNYHLLDYTDELPLAMAAADLVVGRSGASVLEVAALGKPSLLVPYPHATAGHQLRNAEWMAAAGAAQVIRDEELTAPLLKSRIESLLADPARLAAMGEAASRLTARDGAQRIADEIIGISGK